MRILSALLLAFLSAPPGLSLPERVPLASRLTHRLA